MSAWGGKLGKSGDTPTITATNAARAFVANRQIAYPGRFFLNDQSIV
jgi:hypothetical protein